VSRMAPKKSTDKSDDSDVQDSALVSDPGSVALPSPVIVDPGKSAIARYGDLLETSAVATVFSVMSSTRATPNERLEAAKMALDAIGKRTPQQSAPPTPGITLQLVTPIQNAMRGFMDVVDVLDRTPRAEVVEDGV